MGCVTSTRGIRLSVLFHWLVRLDTWVRNLQPSRTLSLLLAVPIASAITFGGTTESIRGYGHAVLTPWAATGFSRHDLVSKQRHLPPKRTLRDSWHPGNSLCTKH